MIFAKDLGNDLYDKVLPLLQIDQVFDGFKQEMKDLMKAEEATTLRGTFFDCSDKISLLHQGAIGCISTCLFCKRKCELGTHDATVQNHCCDTVGH